MKKLSIIIILLIFVFARIKFERIDKNSLKKKEIIIQIKNETNSFLKVKKGSSIADVLYRYNLNLENDDYDLNYILKENDIINLKKEYVSINNITFEKLKEIPFITEKNARKIIEFRKKHGFFKNFEQLEAIEGIGKSKIKILKKFLEI